MTTNKFNNQPEMSKLFIHQLNRVNCTKGYLVRNLPRLAETASFRNMKLAIQEMHEDVKKQQSRIDDIYKLMLSRPSDEGCEVIKAVIEEAHNLASTQGKTRATTDMDILLYMKLIENIELTSFRMLKQINQYIGNEQVTQHLAECCNESAENDELFTMISEEYLNEKVME